MVFLELNGLEFYAYHGHFKEEQTVGSKYVVNLTVKVDAKKAFESDDLNDTVDYTKIYKVIAEEMAIPSKLIEHLLNKIIKRVFEQFESVIFMEIVIYKINPPVGGKMQSFSVRWSGTRNDL
jgi:dihydroneopterin aldolase